MQYIKINEYKYFVLYKNEKTGAKEAFLYSDLRGRTPEKIDARKLKQSGRTVVERTMFDD